MNHFKSRYGAFDTFVAMLASGSVDGLLHVVGGQKTEYYRFLVLESHRGYPL